MENRVFMISGMTCAACARRIEKVLGKLAGVAGASVNYAAEKAMVAYDPQKIRRTAIREAIEKAGYKAQEALKAGAADEDRAEGTRKFARCG